MGIPVISPYSMPTGESLPENIVEWRADPRRAVLLIHDMQHYFVQFFAADTSPVRELMGNIGALRRRCLDLGVPIAYTAQPGDMTTRQRGLLRDFWGPGMSASERDRNVVESLAPDTGDWLFTKWRYSAFHSTNLLECIRGEGRDQLICCGLYAYTGVLMTAVDAFSFDVQPFMVADAVADFTEREHLLAMEYAARRCASVTTTSTVLAALDADPALDTAHADAGEYRS